MVSPIIHHNFPRCSMGFHGKFHVNSMEHPRFSPLSPQVFPRCPRPAPALRPAARWRWPQGSAPRPCCGRLPCAAAAAAPKWAPARWRRRGGGCDNVFTWLHNMYIIGELCIYYIHILSYIIYIYIYNIYIYNIYIYIMITIVSIVDIYIL